MKRTGSSIPTDKGSPCLPWPCKVMPQAVFGKIILATAVVFPKTLHSGTRHLLEVGGMESPAFAYIIMKRI